MAAPLQRVTIERCEKRGWKLVRERAENGETFYCQDLKEAFETVLCAYDKDGAPRPPRSET